MRSKSSQRVSCFTFRRIRGTILATTDCESTDDTQINGGSFMATPRDPRLYSRTKIVATIGPACFGREKLVDLIEAGVDVFRLNMAHAEPAGQQQHVDMVRSLSAEFGEPI